jgi:uncharacterized protein YjbJ (UPF0337 family)
MSAKTDVVKGKLKEGFGALTGNDDLRAAGKTDQAVGKVKQIAEEAVDKVGQVGKKVLVWITQMEEVIMSTATMGTQQQIVQDRKRDETDCPKDQPVPAVAPNTDRMGGVRALGEGIIQNPTVQVGVGVVAAAGAGLLLVSMFSVGAVAVAGAAGYLAYRELSGKKV